MPSMKYRSAMAATALGLVSALAALPAAAQFQKPDQAIKYRQSAMSLQGTHFGRVAAMANGRVPFDAKVAAENIEVVAMLSRLQFSAFIEGTDQGNTRAKPEVWAEKDKFAAAITKSQEDVAKLAAAGKTGSLDQIKAAVGAVGQSCKACHDAYQKPQ
jgi:cytochrome c556